MPQPDTTNAGLIIPPDAAAMERLRMDGVAKRTAENIAMSREGEARDAAAAKEIEDRAKWSGALARGMGAFQLMDGVRRKAFLAGVDFATSSIQLAAANAESQGAPGAAAVLRQLAASIGGVAISMIDIGKNSKARKRR